MSEYSKYESFCTYVTCLGQLGITCIAYKVVGQTARSYASQQTSALSLLCAEDVQKQAQATTQPRRVFDRVYYMEIQSDKAATGQNLSLPLASKGDSRTACTTAARTTLRNHSLYEACQTGRPD